MAEGTPKTGRTFPDHPLHELPALRDVIATHGLSARKKLGQNFLFDLNLTGRIARSGTDLSRGTVVEIGPGPGGLTRALLDAGAAHVIAIEMDPRALPIQAEIASAYPDRLEVLQGDALTIPVHTLGEAPRQVIANLPYNVATPLLLDWLAHIEDFTSIVVMLQKEVVDRLAGVPRTKDYGRLSVMVQFLCTVEPLFDVNPRAFTPPPKVTSTVVRLIPRAEPLGPCSFAVLEEVVACAFNQRRKMLRAALKPLIVRHPKAESVEALLTAAGIEPTKRAEELSVIDFCTLAYTLENL